MIKKINFLKAFFYFYFMLLQVSNSWCTDLSPSVVKIYTKSNYLCTGTLISEKFVLTLSTCVSSQRKASDLKVIGNVINHTAAKNDKSKVKKIYRTEDYGKPIGEMPVALLKLAKSIVGPKIKPAKLCTKNSVRIGAPVTLYSWDISNLWSIPITRDLLLRKTDFVLSNSNVCANVLKNTDKMFCAEILQGDDCFYDKGGPATVDGEFCGIYTHGHECLDLSTPALFTTLTNREVKKFINAILQK